MNRNLFVLSTIVGLLCFFAVSAYAEGMRVYRPSNRPAPAQGLQPDVSGKKRVEPTNLRRLMKPDLIVANLNVTHSRVATDDFDVSARVTIRNVGGDASRPFKVLVEYTDNPNNGWKWFGQYGITSLDAGKSRTTSVPHRLRHGTYKIRVTVDSLNMVDELNENNNQTSVGVILGP